MRTAAPPAQPATWHTALSLPFSPSDVTAIASGDEVYVYLETHDDERLSLYGVAFGPHGERATGVVRLADGFVEPFGRPIVASGGLLVSIVRDALGSPMWEVWRWAPGRQPERLIGCPMPAGRGRQVFVDGEELFAFFEGPDEQLRAYTTSFGAPSCPSESSWVTVVPAPLPSRYRLDWLDGRLVLTGRTGDGYRIVLFDRDLEPQRRLRLASGTASDPWSLRVVSLEGIGPVAVYGARFQGALDIYVARLGQLSIGPLAAGRIVASANAERNPRLYPLGDRIVVSWSVRNAQTREHVELAAIVSDLDTARTSGELLWRHPFADSPIFTSVWTRGGLLRVWIDESGGGATLVASPYRPSFWH